MNELILEFLNRLDALLLPFATQGERFDMYHLGRSALIMHYGLRLATKDIDIVGTGNSRLENKALELLGKNTDIANLLGVYLDVVAQAIPPVPRWFRERCRPVAGNWQVVRLWQLEVHDLATTKLKSFRHHDKQDLQALCDKGLLEVGKLRESLDAAFPWRSPKEGDGDNDPDTPDWGTALTNFKRVEKYLNGELRSL
ncbi:MAG: hypothetical protein JNM56_19560 [Planctomycetia bacterium]|nr:hypothetical protein [Planctomycetia bacterium]